MHGLVAAAGTRRRARLFRSATPIPQSSSTAVGVNRVYAIPIRLPKDVNRVTLRAANRTYSAAVATDVTTDFASYASNGSELATGSPLTTLLAKTIPGNGTVGTIGGLRWSPGSDSKGVLQYSFANPAGFCFVPNADLGVYAEGVTDVTTAQPSSGGNPNPNYWFWFEYMTALPTVVIIGDSISVNYSGGGFNLASGNTLYGQRDWAVSINGVVQFGSLLNYASASTLPFLWDMVGDIVPGAHVVVPLGTNDLNYANLGTMEQAAKDLFGRLRKLGAATITPWTVPPQTAYAEGTIRTTYNADLRANFRAWGADGYYDAAAPQSQGGVADNSDQTILYAPYNVDGTHLNASGQAQVGAGIIASLPANLT